MTRPANYAVTLTAVICALIAGCAQPQLLKGRGEATVPPSGYIIECIKQPELENCKP